MVKADDYGAYFGNEQIVKSECFPLKADELKSSQVKKWLDELDAAGLIVRYIAADGRKYLKLAKWAAHQRIRNQKSKFPPLDDNCCQLTADDSNSQTSAVNCARNPIQAESNTNPNPNPNPNPTTGVSDDYTDDFELFWNVYPKKVGKKDAFNAFKKAKQPVQLLIHAVQEQMQSSQWQKEDGRYIPNPATWLNQGRWDDTLPKPKVGERDSDGYYTLSDGTKTSNYFLVSLDKERNGQTTDEADFIYPESGVPQCL